MASNLYILKLKKCFLLRKKSFRIPVDFQKAFFISRFNKELRLVEHYSIGNLSHYLVSILLNFQMKTLETKKIYFACDLQKIPSDFS